MMDNPILLQQQYTDGHVFGDARLEKRGRRCMKPSVSGPVAVSRDLAKIGLNKRGITDF
jgi:hypothetical protein